MTGAHGRWKCGHKRRDMKPCGREVVGIWCREQGSGQAFVARCKAHARPAVEPGLALGEWTYVEAKDFREYLRARKVRRALEKRALPDDIADRLNQAFETGKTDHMLDAFEYALKETKGG